MRKLFTMLAPVGLLGLIGLGAPAASAQEQPKGLGDSVFKAMDKDGDGRVSEDEYIAASKTVFATMDANHDGKVTADEMTVSMEKLTGKTVDPSGKTAAERIKEMDKDGDGALSAAEHEAGSKEKFAKLDGDKNRYLSPNEVAERTRPKK